MRRAVLVGNLLLSLVFALAFAVLALAPGQVERHARDELARRIADAALERYPELESLRGPAALARGLLGDAAELRAFRDSSNPDALAAIFNAYCRYDCGETKSIAAAFRGILSDELRAFDAALGRVKEWGLERYQRLIGEIIADLRIFTATNALLFVLAGLAVSRQTGIGRVPLILSVVLSLSALLGGYLYLFAQNWLQTLLFADYVGYGYLVWVALIASALLDAAFNEGRVLYALLEGLARLGDAV